MYCSILGFQYSFFLQIFLRFIMLYVNACWYSTISSVWIRHSLNINKYKDHHHNAITIQCIQSINAAISFLFNWTSFYSTFWIFILDSFLLLFFKKKNKINFLVRSWSLWNCSIISFALSMYMTVRVTRLVYIGWYLFTKENKKRLNES